MPDQRYIIGIDLGTTNCAVSYVDLSRDENERPSIEIFPVSQLTGPGEVSGLELLPSFLYLAGEHEIAAEALLLPWATNDRNLVGAFARDQGAGVPGRMVSSAKSWLCHGRVDRRGPILPWGADEDQPGISPVAATAAYLRHIKNAWNHSRAGEEEDALERQRVVITVPASFDEVARDLTLEAARQAGIKGVTLVEEPLAAFYTWLSLHEGAWDELIRPGALVLVCDVGGGTTDFTLIAVGEKKGRPALERSCSACSRKPASRRPRRDAARRAPAGGLDRAGVRRSRLGGVCGITFRSRRQPPARTARFVLDRRLCARRC